MSDGETPFKHGLGPSDSNANERAGNNGICARPHDGLRGAHGRGRRTTTTAMWRLDSKQVIRGEKHVKFVLLLKVPKEVSQLHIEAAAQAEVAYDWLTAQVEHVLEHLSQAIRDALQRRRGLPLQNFQEWVVSLPNR